VDRFLSSHDHQWPHPTLDFSDTGIGRFECSAGMGSSRAHKTRFAILPPNPEQSCTHPHNLPRDDTVRRPRTRVSFLCAHRSYRKTATLENRQRHESPGEEKLNTLHTVRLHVLYYYEVEPLFSARKDGGLGKVGSCRGHLTSNLHHSNLHKMGEITVRYFATAMTTTKLTSETFAVPGGGLKLSNLARLITSRHPNTGIESVLEDCRWSVDGEMIYDLNSFILGGGEEVAVVSRLRGG